MRPTKFRLVVEEVGGFRVGEGRVLFGELAGDELSAVLNGLNLSKDPTIIITKNLKKIPKKIGNRQVLWGDKNVLTPEQGLEPWTVRLKA